MCSPVSSASLWLLIVALFGLEVAAQTTSLTSIFFLYNVPNSLVASVVSVDSNYTTYRVSCPTITSGGVDSCDYQPGKVWQGDGSRYCAASTLNSDMTSTWSCQLDHRSGDVLTDQYGTCMQTLIQTNSRTAGTPTTTTRTQIVGTAVNTCFVLDHMQPVLITAGVEKLQSLESTRSHTNTFSGGVTGYLSRMSSSLYVLNCPTTTPDIWGSATGDPSRASLFGHPATTTSSGATPTGSPSKTSATGAPSSQSSSSSSGAAAIQTSGAWGLQLGVALWMGTTFSMGYNSLQLFLGCW